MFRSASVLFWLIVLVLASNSGERLLDLPVGETCVWLEESKPPPQEPPECQVIPRPPDCPPPPPAP